MTQSQRLPWDATLSTRRAGIGANMQAAYQLTGPSHTAEVCGRSVMYKQLWKVVIDVLLQFSRPGLCCTASGNPIYVLYIT